MFVYHILCWDFVNRFHHTSGVTVVTPTDRPNSACNRCVIDVFGGVLNFVPLLFGFFVGVGAFVIRLNHISSFVSCIQTTWFPRSPRVHTAKLNGQLWFINSNLGSNNISLAFEFD